ncbi:MAG: methyl-accepting chemotaxis protein [Spirochaetales bacterium]|nr:methyl-accepting chemotaxis protein [Spirochaetales bacterium]
MAAELTRKRKSRSLTTILATAFILLSVVTLCISSIIQIGSYLGTQQEAIKGQQGLIAKDAMNKVSDFIAAKQRLLVTATWLGDIGSGDRARREQLLSGLLAAEPYFRNMVYQNAAGRIVVSVSRISRSDTQRFIGALTSDIAAGMRQTDVYISDVYIENLTGEPMAVISILDKNVFKEVQGILIVELNLKFMWDLIDTIKVGDTGKGSVYVVDRQGRLIAFRDTTRVLKGEYVTHLAAVAEFIRSRDVTGELSIWNYRGITGEDVVGTYMPLGSPDWAVVTELPVGDAYRAVIHSTFISVGTTLAMAIIAGIIGIILARRLSVPLVKLTATAAAIASGDNALEARVAGSREVNALGEAFNSMTTQLRSKAESFRAANQGLTEIIGTSRDIVSGLNTTAKEIEAAAQEQTTASNEHASGITEVSATLQELTITARQITNNVGELVLSSEEAMRTLKAGMQKLIAAGTLLEDAGVISRANSAQIGELGKRSMLINEMVELIREVANKTNILSINASIEASRSGEAGSGFSVVAAEIRELSKETIESAKKADKAAKDIQDFLNSIIVSSGNESAKVQESGSTVREISTAMGEVVSKINSNYSFTQKIDVSIKQQETGSVQAAETMRQMAEISRQSAENARQTLAAVKDIVRQAAGLENAIGKFRPEVSNA